MLKHYSIPDSSEDILSITLKLRHGTDLAEINHRLQVRLPAGFKASSLSSARRAIYDTRVSAFGGLRSYKYMLMPYHVLHGFIGGQGNAAIRSMTSAWPVDIASGEMG